MSKLIAKAIEMAKEIKHPKSGASQRQRIVAIASDKRGRILSIGQNSYQKTSPLMLHYCQKVHRHRDKPFLHAEADCLFRLDVGNVYKLSIARVLADNSPALAAPCEICQAIISAYGVKIVEYTT